MSTVLLVVLVLIIIGALPTWGYHNYGYGPSGIVGLLVIVLAVMLLMGRI
jgi:hypothetical protein